MAGVAKLLDSPSLFFNILNFSRAAIKYVFKMYAKKVLKITEIIFIENI